MRPETEDALRTCGRRQADLAFDYSSGVLEPGAYDSVNEVCDAAMVMLETDDSGASALLGMSIALRMRLLAEWQLDIAETGTAQPAETGLTAEEAARTWKLDFDAEIDELLESSTPP